jgi:hypothetical protein
VPISKVFCISVDEIAKYCELRNAAKASVDGFARK